MSKIIRNRERDEETTAVLEGRGWIVLRHWEHESPESVANAIATVVLQAMGPRSRIANHAADGMHDSARSLQRAWPGQLLVGNV